MGVQIEASRTDSGVAVTLAVTGDAGGVAGLTAKVAVRDGRTTNSYLDFNDNTFKSAAWGAKQADLADLTNGFYSLAGGLNIAAMTNLAANCNHLILEYVISGAANGIAMDMVTFRDFTKELSEIHQVHGLKQGAPLVVTKNSRTISGTIVQTIQEDFPAAGAVTITRL
jgi:hypothetical protein